MARLGVGIPKDFSKTAGKMDCGLAACTKHKCQQVNTFGRDTCIKNKSVFAFMHDSASATLSSFQLQCIS